MLGGDALVLRRGSSLGDTLDGLPGVSATHFGPNASRPVLRGLDGDRVRMLSNAGASFDASALSFDHAVPIEPLAVERIEVLRGPAALRYGGSAAGGVVNAIDNRIPRQRVDGLGGAAELRLGGAEGERAAAALVEAGDGRRALHVDAFGRETSDLRVPRHVPVERGVPLAETARVRNSASRSAGAALGSSLTFERGHLGVSAESLDSTYGTVADPGVTIRMKRERLALAGEVRGLAGLVRTVRGQLSRTVYGHREVEASGAVGTVFGTRGSEARLEAEHAPLGALHGTVGAQAEASDFSALGEEAFVPSTRTRRRALFAVEELAWSAGTSGAGARLERATVESSGDAGAGAAPRFGGPRRRDFDLRSASLSHRLALAPGWQLAATWSYSERAPTFYELYANGLHVATAAFEVGDPALAKERGRQFELGLQWKRGADSARVAAWTNRYANYLSLEATGATIDRDGTAFPAYAFRGVRARLDGFEAEGRVRLVEAPRAWQATAKVDHVRATNLDTGQPLPRIAPLRALLGVEATDGPWQARAELDAAARQDRFAAGDSATAGYTLVNLSLSRRLQAGTGRALAFLRIDNVGDSLAYGASTVQTVRGLAPLPGRALKAGVRVTF